MQFIIKGLLETNYCEIGKKHCTKCIIYCTISHLSEMWGYDNTQLVQEENNTLKLSALKNVQTFFYVSTH